MQIVPWDGCAEFYAESAEKFVAFMKSVYASSHLVGMYFPRLNNLGVMC